MDHAFNTNIATQYDVNISVLLHNFKFWTFNNLANKRNIYDGLCWSYDTLEALVDIFPYWSKRQLERVINNAVESGLLKKGNYNQTKYDRTVWYALTPQAYAFYPELLNEKYLKSLYLSISPNGEIDFTEWRNQFPQTVTPIPDTKPDTNPNINNKGVSAETSDNDKRDSFVEFEGGDNQTLSVLEAKEGLEGTNPHTKSDYQNNQIFKCTDLSKLTHYDIKSILENNIFQIPEQIIQDWIANRKKKRAAITQTAWNKINKELTKCKEQGVDPIEAFETMVASGWQSLKADYFNKPQYLPRASNSRVNNMDTSWGNQVFKPFHEIDLGV